MPRRTSPHIRRPALVLASLATLAFIAGPSDAANLVVNGDFEAGTVAAGGHAFTPAPWTSTGPGISSTNWDTWMNTGTTGLPPTFAGVFVGATAAQGVRWAGGWDFEEMGQLLSAPLTPGQAYNVSALVRPGYNMLAGVEFYLGTGPGSPVSLLTTFAPVSAGTWTPQSGTFTAPANSLVNPWFIIRSYDPGHVQAYVGVDDVFLDAVPAPGTGALAGLAVTWAGRRPRRQKP